MDLDTIGFGCPNCGTSLTVPASASGAQGPCPLCGSIIQAPRFLMVSIPKIVEHGNLPPERTLAAPPMPRLHPPDETIPEEPVEKPSALNSRVTVDIHPPVQRKARKSQDTGILGRAATVILMSSFAFAAIAGISSYEKSKQAPKPAADSAEISPHVIAPKPATPAIATSPAKLWPESEVPAEADIASLIRGSSLVLGEFFEAKNLQVRLLMIETKSSAEELAASILAKPLPIVKAYENIGVSFDKAADAVNLLFRVDFETEPGQVQRHLVLLRKPGNLESKVVIDPFLDGFGGRLEKFTVGPNFGTREFRSLLTIHNFANSPDIPNAADKSTVKIGIRQGGKEIAKAYFPKTSALSDKLILMGVKNGVEFPATYTLRWNTEEDPAKPYVELIDVSSLNW